MLILLDKSPKKIHEYSLKYDYSFGQLRTPLTRYAYSNTLYAIDNGCFTKFHKNIWLNLIYQAEISNLLFVTMPDIVGSAQRTLELFQIFSEKIELPKALVLQDGIEDCNIPWNDLNAIFIGGTNRFKESNIALDCCKAAKMLDKWVHVGRVNTIRRLQHFEMADSIDGSGISMYDHMLDKVIKYVKNEISEDNSLIEFCNNGKF